MSSGRVIHSFQERREIDLALQAIARERDEFSREAMARELAARGEAVVPVLLRHLETTNPLLRGAIGLVAMFLPREIVAPRLRNIAANPQHSDQKRMTALMILERYLDEPVEDSLYAELRNPQAVLEQSLREVIEHQDTIPEIVHDYVSQLQDEPVDVAHAVLALIPRFSPEQVVPLLVHIAQDVRPEVAEPALHTLGRMQVPQALNALDALADLLPSPLNDVARRGARKLRMRGVDRPAQTQAHWRVLVSPPDIYGGQTFWLVRESEDSRELIGVVSNIDLGLQFAFRLSEVPEDFVPAAAEGSRTVMVEVPPEVGEGTFLFLDAPLGHVRRWLRDRFRQNYAAEYQLPVVLREHLIRFWVETTSAHVAEAPPHPAPEETAPSLEDATALFEHLALATWYVEIPGDLREERRWLQAGLTSEVFEHVMAHLDARVFPPTFWQEIARRLRCMEEWLLVAGDTPAAHKVAKAAASLERWPHIDNPYAYVLVARGLAMAFHRLQEAREQWER